MLFQSYIFILLFFPLCLLGFWGLKRQKLLQLWLIAFSLWFYGAASPLSIPGDSELPFR